MSVELALKFQRIGRPRILCIGDWISDLDIHCTAERFSQEAHHCPVWKHEKSVWRKGGAAAVDAMVFGLGAASCLVSSQNDPAGKARYFVNGVQMMRIDAAAAPIDPEESEGFTRQIESEIEKSDCVLIADYGKGVCTEEVLCAAIDVAKVKGIPCIVDPAHGKDWNRYKGSTCIKCNRYEWDSRLHWQVREFEEGNRLFEQVITTDGDHGMCLHGSVRFPSRPRNVVDVTGAGDMVLAALGVCIAGGMSWEEACQVANAAAGLKVERRGAVPVPRHEVVVDLIHGHKIIPAELLRSIGKFADCVLTNGCFDGLHSGHLHLLREAKAQGKRLVVAINDDLDVKRLKGSRRPIHSQDDRAATLAALECVDHVVVFSGEEELDQIAETLKPSVLVKGDDCRGKDLTGSQHAGRVHFVETLPGYSTTRTIERMQV